MSLKEKLKYIRTIVQAKEKPKTNQREIHRASEMSLVRLLNEKRGQRVVSGVEREKRRKGARQGRRERARVRETEGRRHAEMGKWQEQRKIPRFVGHASPSHNAKILGFSILWDF